MGRAWCLALVAILAQEHWHHGKIGVSPSHGSSGIAGASVPCSRQGCGRHSQEITAVQLVVALGSLTLAWPPTVEELLNWASVLTFKLSTIGAGCVAPHGALVEYSAKVADLLILLLMVFVIRIVHVIVFYIGISGIERRT